MSVPQHFDYIIAGGGCAGLSLAYHMLQTPLRERKILLIDRDDKTTNNRTWCFWEKEPNPFEEIVYKKWDKVNFYGDDYAQLLDLFPYQYKMIRGIDFYQFVKERIGKCENLQILQEHIQKLENSPEGGKVIVGNKTFTANWIFNSILSEKEPPSGSQYYHLLQHFKGWVVQTEQAVFHPGHATLMDFRIKQWGDTRFVYVLPIDETTALVEYTVFSPDLLESSFYERALKEYLSNFLNVGNYKILHEEFGVIPMTNRPFPSKQGAHIINIGTAGGQTKPSTGYTFTRIQKQTRQLVDTLLKMGKPDIENASFNSRFWWYDSILLNVLLKKRCAGKEVFTRLFKYNSAANILAFLDEQTNIFQEFKITNTLPRLPFLKAMADLVKSKW